MVLGRIDPDGGVMRGGLVVIPPEGLWTAHAIQKRVLISVLRTRSRAQHFCGDDCHSIPQITFLFCRYVFRSRITRRLGR